MPVPSAADTTICPQEQENEKNPTQSWILAIST